jgi:hypothetical protein
MAAKYKFKLTEKVFNSIQDIGKLPFMDKNTTVWRDKNLSQLISQYGEEPNTEQENLFLKNLQTFFTRNKWVDIEKSDLELLLKYKGKFPNILNPAVSTNVVFRGATIPVEDILKMDIKKKSGQSYIMSGPFSPVKSQNVNAPGLSFSSEIRIAEDFATEKLYTVETLVKSNRLPCIYGLRANNPKLLFNPEFIKNISIHDDESEVILVGNSFTPDGIILFKPSFVIENAMSSLYGGTFEETYPLFAELKEKLKVFKG